MRSDAQQQGKQFGRQQSTIFLRIMRRISWESAPSRAELDAVYHRFGWRMIRRQGTRTPEQELARRKRVRGTFARRWFVASVSDLGSRIRILLVDRANYSEEIARRDNTVARAQQRTLRGWGDKLNRIARRLAGNF